MGFDEILKTKKNGFQHIFKEMVKTTIFHEKQRKWLNRVVFG